MSRALEPVDACALLKGDIRYQWAGGGYSYSIVRANDKVLYRVTDGKQSFETQLLYAFGQGKAGQTYVYALDGQFYETRVSYYAKLHALDVTVGAATQPEDLRAAAGRPLVSNDARDCFGCHTTGARLGGALQLDHYESGVQCESCHGPGAAHIDGIRTGKLAPKSIRSLKGMDAEETSEMCGVCHRTWETVMMLRITGVSTVRFPAYRLTNSQCYSVSDSRIACTACHNPHEKLVSDDKFYDSKCAACHNKGTTAATKRMCPVAKQACTSCHMPRLEPPQTHHAFADHRIRVVRSKAAYPE